MLSALHFDGIYSHEDGDITWGTGLVAFSPHDDDLTHRMHGDRQQEKNRGAAEGAAAAGDGAAMLVSVRVSDELGSHDGCPGLGQAGGVRRCPVQPGCSSRPRGARAAARRTARSDKGFRSADALAGSARRLLCARACIA